LWVKPVLIGHCAFVEFTLTIICGARGSSRCEKTRIRAMSIGSERT
jgi:hypothetical protein